MKEGGRLAWRIREVSDELLLSVFSLRGILLNSSTNQTTTYFEVFSVKLAYITYL